MNSNQAAEEIRNLRNARMNDLTCDQVDALNVALYVLDERFVAKELEECQIYPDFKCINQEGCKRNPQLCGMAVL